MFRSWLSHRLSPLFLILVILVAALAVHSQRGGPRARLRAVSYPAPTGQRIDPESEASREENHEKRREWIQSMHAAAPGVDWRAIEEANRQAYALERQAVLSRGIRTDDWTEIGSANLAGRTHCAWLCPDGVTLYVGSDWGGVWRGTLNGSGWTALSDGVGRGSHGLVVVPAGAGPGQPETIVTISNGGTVHASIDAGGNWSVPGGLPARIDECVRILRDHGSPRTVYLLVRGAHYGGSWINGFHLCRSDDGGSTFTVVHSRTGVSPRCDIWCSRVGAGPLYLMRGAALERSTDRGATFTPVGAAPVTADDVVLTACEAGAPTFYAALHVSGQWRLYRSTDGGGAWNLRTTISDFWKTLCASTLVPDLVFYAGVECWRSTNGGASFAKINNWWDYYGDPARRLHADLPGMECFRLGGSEAFFFDTDGGTYVSRDGGGTVENLSLRGLGVSQYYSLLTSDTDPYLIAAGSQDQGYQRSTPNGASPYLEFTQLISGDYGHLTSTTRAHDYLYCVYPGFVLVQLHEENPGALLQLDFPAASQHSWMPFILADPDAAERFWFCADHLWRYEHQGGEVFELTMEPHSFAPGYLTAFAIARSDPSVRYAVTNAGRMWYSHDGGANWSLSPDTGPQAHYFYGTSLLISPSDPRVAYAGGSGYSGPAVYRTTDGGVHWEPWSANLPSTLVFGLAFDNDQNEDLYAAAEAGPFHYDREAACWVTILGTEAPLTGYWCLEGVPELNVVRFGTYGRGIWDYHIPNPMLAEEPTGRLPRTSLRIYPSPARSRTTLSIDLARPGSVDLELFDTHGRRIAGPTSIMRPAGHHELPVPLVGIDGQPLASGTYLLRVTTADGTRVKKVQVIH